jgi:hypothetical protein
MKTGIMQPYFLPYIGYFQLINYVDVFVVYDRIEYSKKGWINRNRILKNGQDDYITLSLKNDSDFKFIDERELSESFEAERRKMIRRVAELYRKAPEFTRIFPLFEEIMLFENPNLFEFVYHSLQKITGYLGIQNKLVVSSDVKANHEIKSPHRIYDFCRELQSDTYINLIGGMEMYHHEEFAKEGLQLLFLKPELVEYRQFNHDFVKGLSILDILMFNDKSSVQNMLNYNYEIVT